MNQKETLMARGAEYGDFSTQASMSQRIENILREGHGWQNMNDTEREAIKMIAHKMARLANGNPHSVDGWHDIGGYAKLVEDRLACQTLSASAESARAQAAMRSHVPDTNVDAYIARPGRD